MAKTAKEEVKKAETKEPKTAKPETKKSAGAAVAKAKPAAKDNAIEVKADVKKPAVKKDSLQAEELKTPVAKKETKKDVKTEKVEEVKTTKSKSKKEETAVEEAVTEVTAKKAEKKKTTKVEDTVIEAVAVAEEKPAPKEELKLDAAIPVMPNVRYSDEDLEEFRRNINEIKDEQLDELRMLKERLEDLTSYDFAEESMIYSMHMAEQGSEAMEKEKTYAQIQRINEYLKKLDEALQRIKEKTYGICRVCGILIAKERLLAVPVTTLSASHKIHQTCPPDGIDRIEPVKGSLL